MEQLFSCGSCNYNELEKFAMLADINKQTSDIQYGTWGLRPSALCMQEMQ